MPFISEQDQATIKQLFDENFVEAVTLVYFTTPTSRLIVPGMETCETCDDVQQLLGEIADLSEKITLEVHNLKTDQEAASQYGVSRVPALLITGAAEGRLRYFGAPTGSEFPNLIHDIVAVSRRETALSDETRAAIGAIADPIHLQVFVTPT